MKFIIVGSSGFVGKHIFSYLKEQGHTVLGTQSSQQDPKYLQFDLSRDRISSVLPSSFLETSEHPVAVISAVVGQIDRCKREKEFSRKINVEKTIQLIQDLKKLNFEIVFFSSGFVFDGKEGNYLENHSTNPINEYGRHKVEVEEYLSKEHPDSLVLRLDKVIGDRPDENHLFSEWQNQILKEKPIVCIKGQVFNPTLVDDVARATLLACQKKLKGIYHLANPEVFLREDLAHLYLKYNTKKTSVVSKPQEEFNFDDPRPLVTNLNSEKLIQSTVINFTSMEKTIQTFLN